MDKTSFGMSTWDSNRPNSHNNQHVIWASGQPNLEWRNSYGQHPFLMFEQDHKGPCNRKWVGIFFLNTNAMEFEFYSRIESDQAIYLTYFDTAWPELDVTH